MLTLESLFTRTLARAGQKPTPAQLAICRVADGRPIGSWRKTEESKPAPLWSNANVRRIFGNARPVQVAPKFMVILAGIRGGKSLLAACKAVCSSQNINLDKLSDGDEVRIPVLSNDVDSAHVVYSHILGIFENDEELKELLVKVTADAIKVKHPSGRIVEIKVTAMARAGQTLVGRWLAGCIFDEAPRMMGDGAVKSLGESLRAISGRMLPGAQVWLIGSPHAPFGPVYDIQSEWFGKASEVYCVVRARGPDLNPVWWTPERCAQQKLEDEDVWLTDVMAEFCDPEESLIPGADIEKATRREPEQLPALADVEYIACMDPATRGNAWTLTITGCYGEDEDEQPVYKVAHAQQWVGSKLDPLKPRHVLASIAKICKAYGIDTATTDQWSVDSLRDIADLVGLSLREFGLDSENRLAMAKRVALQIRVGRLELPPNKQLRVDLLMAKNRVTQNGATLVLPQTGDGRHCDYLPPLMLAMARPPSPRAKPEPPNPHGDFAQQMTSFRGEQSGYDRAAGALLGMR